MQTERLLGSRGGRERVLKGMEFSFWGSENILKLLDNDGFIYCECR